MNLTEDEARQKWCPFGRMMTSELSVASINVVGKFDPTPVSVDRNCRASACMAWRPTSDGRGRCGLAGPL